MVYLVGQNVTETYQYHWYHQHRSKRHNVWHWVWRNFSEYFFTHEAGGKPIFL